MKYVISCVLLCTAVFSCQAQEYGSAKFKKKFNKADALVFDESYLEAMVLLEDMYAYDTTNANLNYLLGVCYLLGKKDHALAIKRLENSTRNVSLDYMQARWKERKAPGTAYYYLGKAYHFKNRFDQAVSNYYNYRSFIEMDDVQTYNQVRLQIGYAENAMELIQNPVGVKITNLGPGINSKYSDYCPIISADGQVLIFTSKREGGTGNGVDQDGNNYDDIYICRKQENGKWGKPKSIGANINGAGHDAAIGLSPDGQLLFIYKDDNNDGNIYFSRRAGDDWTRPQPLGSDINTNSWETHASVNATQDLLIFVSNRPGGQGGRDLWYAKNLPDGNWGLAQNMGSVINTQYEEDSPFITADGKTLIFSSQGHTSMGGFDIFRTEFVDGAWTPPENIGYPINTSEDDIFFSLATDGRHAHYSSRMDGGHGDVDLYRLKLEKRRSKGVAVARGIMKVPAMAYADISARIVVTDMGGAQIGTYRPNQSTGYYILILDPGETYTVSYQADGYDPVVNQVPIATDEVYAMLESTIELEEVVFGADILALQRETDRLGKEREAAKARTAEQERLAAEAAAKARVEAEELAVNSSKETERRKAEQLAETQKSDAAAALLEEQQKTRDAASGRKKAEAKARYEAQQAKQRETQRLAREAITADSLATIQRKQAEAAGLAEAERVGTEKTEVEKEQQAEAVSAAAKQVADAEAKQKTEKERQTKIAEEGAAVQAQQEREQANAAKETQAESEAKQAVELAQRKAEDQAAQIKKEKDTVAVEAARQSESAAKAAQEEARQKEAEQLAAANELQNTNRQSVEKRLAASELKKQGIQERIAELRKRQREQQLLNAEVKEIRVQEFNESAQTAAIDAKAIKAKREAMLSKIADLKKRKQEVAQKKVVDEAAVVEASDKEKAASARKKKLVLESSKKKEELVELQKALKIVEEKVDAAEDEIQRARDEVIAAEKKVQEDIAEEKRIAAEEEKKKQEALAAEKEIREIAEQEVKRLEVERIEAEKIEQEQRAEAERARMELIQLEALAEQQEQVKAALIAEEEKRKKIEATESSAYTDRERLANVETLQQLKELNRQLIQDNLDLKRQLAELNKKLDLILARLDYTPDMEKVELPASSTMRNLQEGRRLILRNIFFDYNRASLRPRSKHELNKLYGFMRDNKDISIVVSGHTDSRGNDDYNMRLSQDRAQAVADYLIRNGISSGRLSAKGYGETRPIALNENADLSDNPTGRQLNRRIEISLPRNGAKGIEVEEINVPKNSRLNNSP